MCVGKKIEKIITPGCSGACAGSGPAKRSAVEIRKQQQHCHGTRENPGDTERDAGE